MKRETEVVAIVTLPLEPMQISSVAVRHQNL
jgi:hypothetical protein